jgi:hypothetical protein
MDAQMDAFVDVTSVDAPAPHALLNGLYEDAEEPSLDALEAELPMVDDEQVPLGELVLRVVQALYAELSELAETCVLPLHARDTELTFSLPCSFNTSRSNILELWHTGCMRSGCRRCRTQRGSEHSRTGLSAPRSRSSSSMHLPNGRGTPMLFRSVWCVLVVLSLCLALASACNATPTSLIHSHVPRRVEY